MAENATETYPSEASFVASVPQLTGNPDGNPGVLCSVVIAEDVGQESPPSNVDLARVYRCAAGVLSAYADRLDS